jgi:hypothetical protein
MSPIFTQAGIVRSHNALIADYWRTPACWHDHRQTRAAEAAIGSNTLDIVMSYLKKVLERLEGAPEFLSSAAVARILEVDATALNKQRSRGSGPPFEQLPGCRPIYSRADLIKWVMLGTAHKPQGMDR